MFLNRENVEHTQYG